MSNTNYPQWVIQGGPTERYLYGVYGFLPSYPAAWTAMALFAAVGLVALIRTVWRTPRCWWMYLLPITCLLEALGYWLRIVNAEQLTMSTVIATIVLLLIPPIIGAVVDYEVMGWMLERANTKLFCLKPKWVAWFFLTGDILSFVIQCGAAGLLTSKDSAAQDTGSKIVLTGLVLQFLIFLFFAYSAIKLWKMPVFAVRRDPATGATQELVPHTKLIFVTLLTTVGLLLLRNVFRLYEYGYALSLKRSSKPKDVSTLLIANTLLPFPATLANLQSVSLSLFRSFALSSFWLAGSRMGLLCVRNTSRFRVLPNLDCRPLWHSHQGGGGEKTERRGCRRHGCPLCTEPRRRRWVADGRSAHKGYCCSG